MAVTDVRQVRREVSVIARMAAPVATAQFGLTAIGLVEVAILGQASSGADLGGASIGRSINFAALALAIGISGAIEPLAAQAIGAKNHDEAWDAFLATLVSCVLVCVPCSLFVYAATSLLAPLGIEPELIRTTRAFVLPQLPAQVAFAVFLVTKSFLQAHDRTSPSLVASLLANVVNVVVCNLLVRGDGALTAIGVRPLGLPALGAFGAGLASTISMLVLAGWVLGAAWRIRPKDRAHPQNLPFGKVFRIGIPIGLQLLAEVGVFALVGVLAGRLGRVAVSAHQIAIGLSSFTFMGALGISGATAVRVGHMIGAGRSPRSAGLVGIGLGAAFMSASAVVFLLARWPLVGLFAHDRAVVELGAGLLIIASAFQLFDGVQAVAAGALRGAADVRFSFFANVGAHWLVGFPLALWLGFRTELGARGLWIGLLAGLALVATLLLGRFIAIAKGPIARA